MFSYVFESTNCLIQSISISLSMRAITFYLNKPDSHDSPELNALRDKFILQTITSFQHEHDLLHNPHSAIFASNSAHTHSRIEGNLNIEVPKIIKFLLTYQDDLESRTTSFYKFQATVEESQKKAGDKNLPIFVQLILDNYDRTTTIIPREEINSFLEAFNNYLSNSQAPMRLLDEINNFILKLRTDKIKGPQLERLMGYPSFKKAPLPDKHVQICYKKLEQTRELFLRYEESRTAELLEQAVILYNEVKILHESLPVMDKLTSYVEKMEQPATPEQTDLSSSFFSSSLRASSLKADPNQASNLQLAKTLLEQLQNAQSISTIFQDIDYSMITDQELATLVADTKQPITQPCLLL